MPTPTAAPGPECETDADCVPAQCCHPMSCIAQGQAPNCNGVMCTMVCQPGTMDCGQGRCICIGGRCGVTSVPTPTPAPTPMPSPTPAPARPCKETDARIDFTHRGTTLGEYNGVVGLWEDICNWNGNETVLREYYCIDSERSPKLNYTEHLCVFQCYQGACDDDCVCSGGGPEVCGVDNRTYRNDCFARCAGTTMARYGQCEQLCFPDGLACKTDSDCCSSKCDPWSGRCAECIFDSDCGGGQACRNGKCGG